MANVTQSYGNVGWVLEPSVRGTTSLVFSCISTIAICTWTTLHLDLPDKPLKGTFLRKLRYLAVALLGLEVFTMIAFEDWYIAHALTKKKRTFKTKDEWSSSLSHLVIMGGVVVRDVNGEQVRLKSGTAPDFVRNGWINLQDLTPVIVADRCKADVFTKLIALLQTTWFLLQLVGRAASHLTITTLELFTLAYVCCAFWSFGFWLHKPLDIHLPLIIDASPTFIPIRKQTQEEQRAHDPMNGNDINTTINGLPSRIRYVAIILCCALFGGCHILAWNADFPSHVEHILWRVSSVSCVVMPLIMFLLAQDDSFVSRNAGRWRWIFSVETTFRWGSILLYIVVRFYLLFEAFFSLRSVSPDVYTAVPWAQYIPHL